MVQIIERQPTTSDRFMQAVGTAAGAGAHGMVRENQKRSQDKMAQEQRRAQEMQSLQEDQRIRDLTGMDISGIKDPKIRQKVFEMHFQEKEEERKRKHEMDKLGFQEESKSKKTAQDLQEKAAPYISGLQTIQEMRKIKNKGNLGVGSSVTGLFSPETRKDRAQYSQLGKSLISLASTIPIRNQQEFQTLAESLYDASASEAELEGVLDAMENIIKRSMQQFQGGESSGQNPVQAPQGIQKERPPLSSFHE